MMADSGYIPRGFNLQWHITDRCNLACKHCYQDTEVSHCHWNELKIILDKFCRFIHRWRTQAERPVKAHITLTGGEPLVHESFWDILNEFKTRQRQFTFSLLTNGTLIDLGIAEKLAYFGPTYVQVSMDGNRETHEALRGRGAFDQALKGIKNLLKYQLRTTISFTAHRQNYHEFAAVAKIGRKLGVDRIWTDRFLPAGRGADLDHEVLDREETRCFYEMVRKQRDRMRWIPGRKTVISMHRALQFLAGGGRPYQCCAADSLLTIMPDGTVSPCRRLPITLGNALIQELDEIYYGHPMAIRLRDFSASDTECGQCVYRKLCRGGLRCLAYAVNGDPFRRDPGCWL